MKHFTLKNTDISKSMQEPIYISPKKYLKIQTTAGYANNLREAVPKMLKDEGVAAFYKGLIPLWMRQVPYTMVKFSCFERTVELLYK